MIHICHAMPMPCSDHALLLKATAQHGPLSTAVLCCDLEKNGIIGAWHGHGMASVNQTRPHCVNQIGKTHTKPLAARHGSGTAWTRHGHGMLCVNRPLIYTPEPFQMRCSIAIIVGLCRAMKAHTTQSSYQTDISLQKTSKTL